METTTSPLVNNAAVQDDIHPENVSGNWYVNEDCIGCDLCENDAPRMFRAASDGSQSIVHHQPNNEEGCQLTREAAENCPVDAILERAS